MREALKAFWWFCRVIVGGVVIATVIVGIPAVVMTPRHLPRVVTITDPDHRAVVTLDRQDHRLTVRTVGDKDTPVINFEGINLDAANIRNARIDSSLNRTRCVAFEMQYYDLNGAWKTEWVDEKTPNKISSTKLGSGPQDFHD